MIACGGVAVRPGDVILADRDRRSQVLLKDAAEVAKLAADQVARETKRLAEIEKGVLVAAWRSTNISGGSMYTDSRPGTSSIRSRPAFCLPLDERNVASVRGVSSPVDLLNLD